MIQLRFWNRRAGAFSALALALLAQALLNQTPPGTNLITLWSVHTIHLVAYGLLALAMLLFCAAVAPMEDGRERQEEPTARPRVSLTFNRTTVCLALAVLSYLVSLALYLSAGESVAVRALWLAGPLLLLVAYLPTRSGEQPAAPQPQDAWWEWALLAILTAAAFALRAWQLTTIPGNIDGDITVLGREASKMIGQPTWIGVGYFQFPHFMTMVAAWSMRLFGQNLYGLLLGSVLVGTATVPAVYWLGRELAGRRVGLLAAALLTISYTHNHLSRIVIPTAALLIVTLLFASLWRGLRTRHGIWFAVAGIMLGLSPLVYYAARVAPVVLILLCLWYLFTDRRQLTANLPHWGALLLGALLAFGPMLIFTGRNLGAFMGRAAEVTIVNPVVYEHLLAKYGVATLPALLVQQIERTLLTFHLFSDTSPQFGFPGPMLDWLAAALLTLGLGLALARLRQPRFFLLVSWFGVSLVLGGVLTNDPPNWIHLSIVLPVVVILAAQAGDHLLTLLAQPLGYYSRLALVGLLLVVLGVVGASNWQAYAAWSADSIGPRSSIARFVSQLPGDTQVLIVQDPYSWQDSEFQFLNRAVSGRDITFEEIRQGALPPADRPLAFIVPYEQRDLLSVLQTAYPSGVLHDQVEHGWQTFSAYLVTPPGASASSVEPYVAAPPSGFGGDNPWPGRLAAASLAALCLVQALRAWRRRTPAVAASLAASPLAFAMSPAPAMPVASQLADQPDAPAVSAADQPGADRSDDQPDRETPSRMPVLSWRALAGILLALGLAYLAQAFYDGAGLAKLLSTTLGSNLSMAWFEPNRLRIGTLLYVLAMALFGWLAPAAWTRPDASSRHQKSAGSRWPRIVRSLLLLSALGCAAFGLARFAQQGEDRLIQALWLLSMLLFLASQAPWPARVASGNRQAPTSASSVEPSSDRGQALRRLWPTWTGGLRLLILAVILSAAFWLRVNHLETIPYDFHGDMASYGIQAREIILGNQPHLFQEGWANIPMIGYLPTAASMALFGNNLFGLNMTAVIAGLLSLLALYLFLWRLFDSHRLALLSVAVAVINSPLIHFSRLAAYMDPWPFNLFALFLLVDGLRARRNISFALAGITLGFGLQMYYSGRVIIFVIAGFLFFALLFRRAWIKDNLAGLGLLALGLVISLGPSLIYFARNQEAFVERSRAVFLFYPAVMNHLMGKYSVSTPWAVFLEQTRRSLLMFHVSVDTSTQFGYYHPMFSSPVSPLIALGFGYAVRRWRSPGAALALIFYVLNLFIGSILTGDAPFWPRLVGMMFAGAWFAGLALDRLWAVFSRLRLRGAAVNAAPRPAAHLILAGLTVIFLTVVGWQDWRLYAETVKSAARPQTVIGRYLRDLPPTVAACDFAGEYALQVRETAFLAWPRPLIDLPGDAPNGLIESCPGPPFVWIIYPDQPARLDALRARWPDGVLEDHHIPNGQVLFTSYLVSSGEPTRGTQVPPVVTPEIGAPPVSTGYHAFYPDGALFEPAQTFVGDTSGTVWEINAGPVTVTGGKLVLHVGPLPGYDGVYDYARLVAANGQEIRVEAEDAATTSGDVYAATEGPDGHWWNQAFNPFSGGRGLVAQKNEMVPALTTTIAAPDGEYTLFIGSFKGDPKNGIFALGLKVVVP
ncbi:ArnT family glycosyltransferase [Candidatus Amarolinea aalborgensis]|uniref:ArnT family glycosyltransferase n=1 Tax=Candidatus Amarolinea aalborgensis TaxID=2249329 RepID=UPI003BF965B7